MENEEDKKLINYLIEKINKLEKEKIYLKECVEFWKWGFHKFEEQNTSIILRMMNDDEQQKEK